MPHLLSAPSITAGGIRLEKRRAPSLKNGIQGLAEKEFLTVPLYGAEESQARLVKPGDRVRQYQPLTAPLSKIPAVFAPAAGCIEEIRPMDLPLEGGVLCAILRLTQGEKERAGENLSGKADGQNYKNRGPVGREDVLQAAVNAGIRDEFSGVPLHLLLERFRRSGVEVLVGCGLDDDPYADSSGAVLRELSMEVAEGLRLMTLTCGAKRTMLAASSFYTWHRTKLSLRASGTEAQVVSVGGKTPARGVLAKRLRRSVGKAGFIGVQACAALYKAVTEKLPQTETVVTVSGDGVWKPGNFRVPVGIPLKRLLQASGMLPEAEFVYIGPALSGEAVTNLELPVTFRTRCITALKKKPANTQYACIGCSRCAKVCMRGILPWLVHDVLNRDTVDPMLLWNAEKCVGCHSCSAACPAGIDLAAEVARAAAIRKSGDFK